MGRVKNSVLNWGTLRNRGFVLIAVRYASMNSNNTLFGSEYPVNFPFADR